MGMTTAKMKPTSKGRGDYTMLLLSGERVACSRTYMDELKGRLDIVL